MSTVVIRYDGVDITSDVVYKETYFTMQVNGLPGAFSMKVKDVNWTKFFRSGKEVTVEVDGTRVFGGFSLTAGEVYAFAVDNTVTRRAPRFWVITGNDYNLLLLKRVLYDHADPTNMNLRTWAAGSRIDDVINYVFDNYTDLPADGVTRAGVTDFGSPNPDQDGVIGTASIPFGQACALANSLLNGVFYIDADKDFNFTDVDTPTSPYTLTDHPSAAGEYGFREMTVVYDAGDMVNDQLSWGVGQSPSPVFARVQDATSISQHGRWQGGEMLSNIYKQASINKRADAIVNGNEQSKRGHKDDKKAWQVVTFQPIFKVGQKVAIESEVFGISDVLPIRRMTIKFPSRRKPRFELVLSHELDQPWTIYEFLFPKFRPVYPPRIEIQDPPPEGPDTELPGDFVGVESEITTLHLADRDEATSYEFNIFNHFTDAFSGQEHFHVKPEATLPNTLSDSVNLLSAQYWANPGPNFGQSAYPHNQILRGLVCYGRYLSFALPAGAYYAKVRWDRLMVTQNHNNYDLYDASGFPFSVRNQYIRYPDRGKNVGYPVVFRRGHWGTDAPTLRPTEWGETIESTTAFNKNQRVDLPPGHYSQSWKYWEERDSAPDYFPFEVSFPILPGEEYLQFWLWWVEPRPFFDLIGTLTDQTVIINGTPYDNNAGPYFIPGDNFVQYPDPQFFALVQPLLENDVVSSGTDQGMEIQIFSRTQSIPSGSRITVCHRAAELTSDRLNWGTPSPYVPGSTNVYFSGAAQRLGIDYTELDSALGLISFTTAVPSTETVTVCYVPNGSY